jgi:signal transduction histidine kinase/CheY-like chemotaxis protein
MMSIRGGIEALRTTSLRMWSEAIGRVAVIVFAILAAVYLFQLGPDVLRGRLTAHLDRIVLPFLIVLFVVRTRSVERVEERRFWRLLIASLVLWLSGTMLYMIGILAGLPRWVDLAVDVSYILMYLFMFLTSDQQPQLEDGWSRRDVVYPFALISAVLFIAIMFGYFVVVPWAMQPSENTQYFASFNLYVTLDTLLTFRFLLLFRASTSRRWRRCFALLATATAALAVGDFVEGLYFAKLFHSAIGDPVDVVWLVPPLCLAAVGLTCTRGGDASDEPAGDGGHRVQSLMPFYAFVLPLVHLGLYLLGYLDPGARAPREAIVFSGLVVFAGISLMQQISLEKAVASLRSDLVVRALDDRLRQSQRMEAIGRLAGGIAHDFNNLLMVIRSYAELGRRQAAVGDARVDDKLVEIDRAADRASDLVRQLLAFGRRQELHPEIVDVNRLVSGLEGMLGRLLGDDVELAVDLAADDVTTRVDPALLEQVIVNLAVNARDAMPRGGRLEIATRVAAAGSSDGDPVVELEVRDDGVGIDPTIRDRIFEPYFTTKEMEKGTGLGLATVYGIVQQSGGTIDVESRLGRGSVFTVRFPRVAKPATQPIQQLLRPEQDLEGRTVLITEDENSILEAMVEYFEALGMNVLQAPDGVAALQTAEDHDGDIDILVTDLVMPRMSGPDLVRVLLAQRPDIRVVYVSGYTPEAMRDYGGASDDAVFLQKPFLLSDLADTIRQMVDR